MNAPVAPPVDLANLARIAKVAPIPAIPRKRAAKKAIPVSTLLTAAGVLAWRLAPIVLERRRRSSRRSMWIAGGLGAATLALGAWQLQRLFTAEPVHEVETRRGPLEIRRYPSIRVAETTVDRTWDEALDEGFRRLAGFIFGGNVGHKRLAMTTPVLGTGDGAGFRVSFVMPEGDAIPTPDDARISVSDVPSRRIAVLRFAGRYDAHTIEAKKLELVHALAVERLKPRGEAYFAGYDPPSTLPLLRRNELWVELEEI